MADLPDCPECESRMLHGRRPFMRIFGDIRAYECSACDYILITEYPFNAVLADKAVGLKANTAE
jgi:rubredoxin